MSHLFTLERSDVCSIFLDHFLSFLAIFFFIFQFPTIHFLVTIFSTGSTSSSKELSFVSSLDFSALIVAAYFIQGHFILRPTMFPLELQVALLESFLDFIYGYQCCIGSSFYLNLLHNAAILSSYTCHDVSNLVLFIKHMIQLLKLVYLHGQ